ncbi:hypothetical protein DV736_g3331, partial [Chaetothyriales sp. CBS 134916]
MSSPPWQDRRFMFPAGKQVHEPARKTSIPESGDGAPRKLSITSPGGLATLNNPASSGGSNIASKNIFLTGKQVHEGARSGRKSSGSSGSSGTVAVKPTVVPPPPVPAGSPGASGRRRSSASAQGSGLFSGLMASRSNDETNTRRESWKDVTSSSGSAVFGGLFGAGSKK